MPYRCSKVFEARHADGAERDAQHLPKVTKRAVFTASGASLMRSKRWNRRRAIPAAITLTIKQFTNMRQSLKKSWVGVLRFVPIRRRNEVAQRHLPHLVKIRIAKVGGKVLEEAANRELPGVVHGLLNRARQLLDHLKFQQVKLKLS